MDYASLKTAVATWAFRAGDDDFEAAIPTMIELAEVRLNAALRVSAMEAAATVTLTDGVGTLPADFMEMRQARNSGCVLELDAPSPDLVAGRYSITGDAITVGAPSPASITISYYAQIPALSDSNTTNWLLAKAPNAYLYAALIEAAPFMMDDSRLATWTSMYERAVSDLRRRDAGYRYAGSRMRVRGPTP